MQKVEKNTTYSTHISTTAAIIVITCAVLIRFVLMRYGWAPLNSDEATMGLAALHIAYSNAHPLFLYGQDYMGTLEAYLAAAMFHIFGISTFALRLGMVFFFAIFLSSTYFLTCLLSTRLV